MALRAVVAHASRARQPRLTAASLQVLTCHAARPQHGCLRLEGGSSLRKHCQSMTHLTQMRWLHTPIPLAREHGVGQHQRLKASLSTTARRTVVASVGEVSALLRSGRAVMVLDVRGADEAAKLNLEKELFLLPSSQTRLSVLHCPVTVEDTSALTEEYLTSDQLLRSADSALHDTVAKSEPPVVLVVSATGRRAAAAQEALSQLGVPAVVNASSTENLLAAIAAINSDSDAQSSDSSSRNGITSGSSSNASAPSSSDEKERSWLARTVSPYWRLARLDRPIGTMLLLWPCCWSVALAAPMGAYPDLGLLALMATGAVMMRGAGCTINDWWDSDVDKYVARTATRPIASGEVSPNAALGYFAAQTAGGALVLFQLPPAAVLLGVASMPLVIGYPLAKRVIPVPQLVLGVTLNWGALLGGAAALLRQDSSQASAWELGTNLLLGQQIHGGNGSGGGSHSDASSSGNWTAMLAEESGQWMTDVSLLVPEWAGAALPLYGGAVAWTIVYDTLYAHQDKADDKKLGLHSSALFLGDDATKPVLLGVSAVAVGGITAAGAAAGLTWPFYAACGAGATQLARQVQGADLNDSTDLWHRFVASNWFGAIITAGIVAGHF